MTRENEIFSLGPALESREIDSDTLSIDVKSQQGVPVVLTRTQGPAMAVMVV